jgi:peptidoglycan/xylan/chitin deacetylase (PgdA/CDA1 family)
VGRPAAAGAASRSLTLVPEPRWPDRARAACAFTFDLDAEALWLARGVSEPVALSQGRYGVLEGLPRILELLRGAGVRASFFVPAWVAEHHPDAVGAIVAAGHEVGSHGDVHERVSELDAAREEKVLRRSIEVLSRLAGRRPLGYRAPAWQLSERTIALLVRHGFDYASNMMDRLTPYLHPPVEGRALVEVPVSWVLDDAPYFLFTGQRSLQPVAPVLEGWLAEFDGIVEAGGIATFTFHPQLIGRPGRLAALRALIDHVQRTPGVWVAALEDVSRHWRSAA